MLLSTLDVRKNEPPPTMKRTTTSSDDSSVVVQTRHSSSCALTPPELRTLEEWQALSRKIPTLSANGVNVPSTGYSSPIAKFLVDGFSFGFRIGFMGNFTPGRDRNNRSAFTNEEATSTDILKEVNRGHTLGPFAVLPFAPFHCSPLGSVPEKDGSYRLITNLSSPAGLSINDGISSEFFTVKYSSFDDAVSIVHDLGPGCFMAKIDIKNAFRLCPVNPRAYGLFGVTSGWLNNSFKFAYFSGLDLPHSFLTLSLTHLPRFSFTNLVPPALSTILMISSSTLTLMENVWSRLI